MASKFIALPVTQGDCFYLERESKVIVFDGGRYPRFSALLFKQYTSKDEIDYLICSHNDADHASGILGLIGTGISIKEVWLPGRWLEIISEVYENHDWVYDVFKSSREVGQLTLDELNTNTLEEYGADYEGTKYEEAKEVEKKIEELCESEIFQHGAWRSRLIYHHPFSNLFNEAIRAADRIIEIAKLAYAHGSRIRWFDYDEYKNNGFQTMGGEAFLKPQNSVEIARFKKTKIKFLYKLALSVANRESLVFLSETENEPKVLFTADSDMANINVPAFNLPEELIVTAPHHGSDSNQNVYNLFKNKEPLWVRSDMRSRKRPCKVYRELKYKYCTLCDNPLSTRSPVKFHSNGSMWQPMSTNCNCKITSQRLSI